MRHGEWIWGSGDNGYDASVSAAFIAIAIVFVAVELIVIVALYVVNSIAFMRLFRRTGVEPWAAWVPVYGPPLVGYGSARGPYVPPQPPSASQQA